MDPYLYLMDMAPYWFLKISHIAILWQIWLPYNGKYGCHLMANMANYMANNMANLKKNSNEAENFLV